MMNEIKYIAFENVGGRDGPQMSMCMTMGFSPLMSVPEEAFFVFFAVVHVTQSMDFRDTDRSIPSTALLLSARTMVCEMCLNRLATGVRHRDVACLTKDGSQLHELYAL